MCAECRACCAALRFLQVEDIALWHERDISHSSVERVIWPDMFHLIHYMTKIMTRVISGLVVNEDKMLENIEITKGLLFSGRVLLALVEKEGLSREDAYAIAQSNAMRCWNEKVLLADLLKSDTRITKLTADELDSLFDLGYYLKHIDEIFNRFPELENISSKN